MDTLVFDFGIFGVWEVDSNDYLVNGFDSCMFDAMFYDVYFQEEL